MACQLLQLFQFEKVYYLLLNRRSDVLDISFGPPAPAIHYKSRLGWLFQVRLSPPLALLTPSLENMQKAFANYPA